MGNYDVFYSNGGKAKDQSLSVNRVRVWVNLVKVASSEALSAQTSTAPLVGRGEIDFVCSVCLIYFTLPCTFGNRFSLISAPNPIFAIKFYVGYNDTSSL